MESCSSEVLRLRARVATLEAQLAATALAPVEVTPRVISAPVYRNSTVGLDRRLEECTRQRFAQTNLRALLPSLPDADLSLHDGRCSRRYADLDAAWTACMAEPACAGVVRDNGLRCSSPPPLRGRGKGGGRRQQGKLEYELRGHGIESGATVAWACPSRLAALEVVTGTFAAPRSPSGAASAAQGYIFITLGACARPGYACHFVRETRDAIRALRLVDSQRPIAVLSDGSVPTQPLLKATGSDLVTVIDVGSLRGKSKAAGTTADLRVRKLLAYGQSPFEQTVFLDADTHARPSASSVAVLSRKTSHSPRARARRCRAAEYRPRPPAPPAPAPTPDALRHARRLCPPCSS